MATATQTTPLFSSSEYQFDKSQAYKRLTQLAENPFDLTAPGNISPERLRSMKAEACGFKLLFGTQRLDDQVLQALFELGKESSVLEKMSAMQAGAVINYIEGHESEHRSVLHTAMRDFFENPNCGPKALEATALAKAEYDKLDGFLKKTDKKFTDLVFIGIGGSELGPKTLYFGLQAYLKPHREVHFISNVDPDDVAHVMKDLELPRTLVICVSKSGSTLETQTNEEMVREWYRRAGINPQAHFVAITGKGSPMDDAKRYLESFYIWDYVGGRFCGSSMVGGVMLSFAYGIEVYKELLRGANAMDKNALEKDMRKNLPLLAALIGVWNRNFLHYPTLALVPYSQMLIRFSAHVQQCDMESNGKHVDRQGHDVAFSTGPIVWGEPATNAQHSFFQLIHQGTDCIPLEFIGFHESQYQQDLEIGGTTSQEKLLSNLFAQALALAIGQSTSNPNKGFKGNRPSSILLAQKLDPFTLGGLLAYYEHKAAFQGFIWNINSFDQEGVQLGKVLANKILHIIAARNSKGKSESYPLGEALLDQLNF